MSRVSRVSRVFRDLDSLDSLDSLVSLVSLLSLLPFRFSFLRSHFVHAFCESAVFFEIIGKSL